VKEGLVVKEEGDEVGDAGERCDFEEIEEQGEGGYLPGSLQEFLQKYDPSPQGLSLSDG
jgi:hypothetical protein